MKIRIDFLDPKPYAPVAIVRPFYGVLRYYDNTVEVGTPDGVNIYHGVKSFQIY